MPNWVRNVVKVSKKTMDDIEKKYFTKEEDGTFIFDFDKLIPMPKSLKLRDGTITNVAIAYALSKMDINKKNNLMSRFSLLYDNFYGNYWNKITKYTDNYTSQKLEDESENFEPDSQCEELGIKNLEELGNTYINNIETYRCCTWYDWSIKNWGTKWNVCEFEHDDTTMIFETAWSCPGPILEELSKKYPKETIEVKYADEDIGSNCGYVTLINGIDIHYSPGDMDFANYVWDYHIASKEFAPQTETSHDIVDDMTD